MSIKEKLSYVKGRGDQGPNKQLAQEIVEKEGHDSIRELIALFDTKPHVAIQKDCSLTLAWIAKTNPQMMVHYTDYFLNKLGNPVNRVIWGSMITLTAIAPFQQEKLFENLPDILHAMDTGTVVTRDHGYRILITLYQNQTYQKDVFTLILEQLTKAPSNQLGQYAERLIDVLNLSHKPELMTLLESRFEDIENEHHVRRLEKNLKKLSRL